MITISVMPKRITMASLVLLADAVAATYMEPPSHSPQPTLNYLFFYPVA